MYSGLTAMKKKSVAVVIISNGPGELTTWVNPVVDELNKINQSLCNDCLLYTSPSPRDKRQSRMPSSA